MIHYKLKKKDYISPHLEVMWMDKEALLDDLNGSIYGEGKDLPGEEWGSNDAKSSGVTHFDSDFEFEDGFEDSPSGMYNSYKVEW